ncbi:MAG: oligosaccharide flippase family protein [Aggregatilineales bacterium]
MTSNIIGTLIRRFATLPLGLITILVLARTLNPDGLGQYNLAIFLPQLISTFLNFGIGPANIFYMGRDASQLPQAYWATILIWGVLSAVGLLIAIPLIVFFSDLLFPDVPALYLWLSLVFYPILLLQIFWLSLLQGTQNFREFNIISVITPLISLILMFIAVVVFKLDVVGALATYIFGQAISVGMAGYVIWRKIAGQPRGDIRAYIFDVFRYGWKANSSNIVAFLSYRIDIYLINLLLNPVAVGLYFAAVRFVELLWLPASAVTIVLGPRIAQLYQDEISRQRLTPLIARATFAITFLLALAMIFIGFPIFRIMGSAYSNSYSIFLILMPGAVMMVLSKVLSSDLASRGHLKLNFYTAVITLTLEVSLIAILAYRYKLTGVAIASSLAYGFQAFISLYFYTRVTGLRWWQVILPNQTDLQLLRQVYKYVLTRARTLF